MASSLKKTLFNERKTRFGLRFLKQRTGTSLGPNCPSLLFFWSLLNLVLLNTMLVLSPRYLVPTNCPAFVIPARVGAPRTEELTDSGTPHRRTGRRTPRFLAPKYSKEPGSPVPGQGFSLATILP